MGVIGIIGRALLAYDGLRRNPLVGVVGILQVLKSHALLGGISRGPARAGTERIQVLVDAKVVQRIGRLIHVKNVRFTREEAAAFIERGGDLIRDALLPIGGIDRKHGLGISRLSGEARKEK